MTLGVFAWALTQPGPDTYDFGEVPAPSGGTDLLTGRRVQPAALVRLGPRDVVLLREGG